MLLYRLECDTCDKKTDEYPVKGGAVMEAINKGWWVERDEALVIHCLCETCRKTRGQ